MSHLSAAQTRVVGAPPDLPEGVEWPHIEIAVHDLGEIDEAMWTRFCRGHPRMTSDPPRGQRPSAAPYLAVFVYEGQWFVYTETHGGSSRGLGHATREEAVAEAHAEAAMGVGFWMEKVKWRLAGDVAAPAPWERRRAAQQVIRCAGVHYVVGDEPSASERRSPYGGLGFGGRAWAFELLDGRRVETHNLWHQGDIPAEFADLLPDNAVQVKHPDEIERERSMAEFREKLAAQALERAWRDDGLRAWRGPADELRAHETHAAHEAAEREQRRRDDEERAARTLAQDWADEAYRAWRGSWTDLEWPMRVEWDLICEEQDMWAEMYREMHGY